MVWEHCEHVFRDVKYNPCELCGKETHAIDWAFEAKLRKKWVEDGKADASICPVEGGTLRGWWSI